MLYEVLKTAKMGAGKAPDLYTALLAKNLRRDGEVKILSGIPPLTFPSNGAPLIDLLISGNEEHNGTPTPDSPVMPQGTGERTGNLCDKVFASGYNVTSDGYPAPYTPNNSRCATLEAIDVSNQNTVTFSYTNTVSDNKRFIYSLFNGNTLVTREADKLTGTAIDVSQGNKLYLCVYSNLASVNAAETTINIMLNSGSAPLPYEPYGYKIPISSASTTIPVYLGEVETTRKIKKLVLTGEEIINKNYPDNVNDYLYYTPITSHGDSINIDVMCTHLPYTSSIPEGLTLGSRISNSHKSLYLNFGADVMNAQPSGNTKAGIKEYLAAQYAAGTPVTVWYVLANEETGIVNEPLHKIGDYADTLSMEQAGVEIPTARGTNTLDVLTDVKPSEVYIKYKE